MHEFPADWNALCALVLLLGLRHGFDADHLATIDGLTRLSARDRRPFARYCGVLFSLGHGLVVLSIAAALGAASERWEPPVWLNALGAWISVGFLALLGVVNLRAVLAATPGAVVALVGVRGRWLRGLLRARNPLSVALVGALFALSFDTLSQSALFAATATQYGGLIRALTLALLFVFGMLVTDGINGLWISRLIARADQIAVLASRVMGSAVAGASLLVAAFGVAKLTSPAIADWGDGKELAVGLVVVLVATIGYLLARALVRSTLPAQAAAAVGPSTTAQGRKARGRRAA